MLIICNEDQPLFHNSYLIENLTQQTIQILYFDMNIQPQEHTFYKSDCKMLHPNGLKIDFQEVKGALQMTGTAALIVFNSLP